MSRKSRFFQTSIETHQRRKIFPMFLAMISCCATHCLFDRTNPHDVFTPHTKAPSRLVQPTLQLSSEPPWFQRDKSARPSTDDVYPDFGDSNVAEWLDMVKSQSIQFYWMFSNWNILYIVIIVEEGSVPQSFHIISWNTSPVLANFSSAIGYSSGKQKSQSEFTAKRASLWGFGSQISFKLPKIHRKYISNLWNWP